jgi:hypothetical protein
LTHGSDRDIVHLTRWHSVPACQPLCSGARLLALLAFMLARAVSGGLSMQHGSRAKGIAVLLYKAGSNRACDHVRCRKQFVLVACSAGGLYMCSTVATVGTSHFLGTPHTQYINTSCNGFHSVLVAYLAYTCHGRSDLRSCVCERELYDAYGCYLYAVPVSVAVTWMRTGQLLCVYMCHP